MKSTKAKNCRGQQKQEAQPIDNNQTTKGCSNCQ